MSVNVDPFLVEFLVNFRWLLHYASRCLDLDVERQFPQLVTDAEVMESLLSSSSCAAVSSIGAVPFGVLQMAKSCYYYLLVASGVLGDCPPSMYPFLRAAMSAEGTAGEEEEEEEGGRAGPQQSSVSLRGGKLNTSSGTATSSVDTRSAATVDDADFARAQRESRNHTQAAVMVLRWLVRAEVLPREELALMLSLIDGGSLDADDGDLLSEPASASGSRSSRGSSRGGAFRVSYRRAARRLCQLSPFYLGAHLLVSRCLLMHHASNLLSARSIALHVDTLNAAQQTKRPMRTSDVGGDDGDTLPPLLPPSQLQEGDPVELALVHWLRCVAHHTWGSRVMMPSEEAVDGFRGRAARGRPNVSVNSTLDTREWKAWLAQMLLKSNLYDIAADGIALGLVCYHYQPHLLPLHALRPPPFPDGHGNAGSAERPGSSPAATLLVRNWAAVLRCAEGLGLVPCLMAEELARHGTDALQLHVLRFAQELFAVLATGAEEDLRTSTDLQREEEALLGRGCEFPVALGGMWGDNSGGDGAPPDETRIMREEESFPDRSGGGGAGVQDEPELAAEEATMVTEPPVLAACKGPIVAQRKKSAPKGEEKRVGDDSADEFPSPPKVFDVAEQEEASPPVLMNDSSSITEGCGTPTNDGAEGDTARQRRIQVYPEGPAATHGKATPFGADGPRHAAPAVPAATASAALPPADLDEANWPADQPLFTSSSTSPGLVVSKTTVDAQSRVLREALGGSEDDNCLEADSSGGNSNKESNSTSPSSASSSSSSISDIAKDAGRVSPPSSVEAASAHASSVRSVHGEKEGVQTEALVDTDTQLRAFLAEEEVTAVDLVPNRHKYSITSSASIPVDVVDSRDQGVQYQEEKVVDESAQSANSSTSSSSSSSRADREVPDGPYHHREDDERQSPVPPDTEEAPSKEGPLPECENEEVDKGDSQRETPVQSSTIPSAARASVTIRKWMADPSSSSSSSCTNGEVERSDDAPKQNKRAKRKQSLSSTSELQSARSGTEAATPLHNGPPKLAVPLHSSDNDDWEPTPRETDSGTRTRTHTRTRTRSRTERCTPESAGDQTPTTPASIEGESEFLPVEGSPFPSLMSGASRGVDDGDSHFSSVSRLFSDWDGGDARSQLLSQLQSPSQLTEADAKLLLSTVARQEELIRHLARQLQSSKGRRPSTSAAAAASISSLNVDAPVSVRMKAVSFLDSSATPLSRATKARKNRPTQHSEPPSLPSPISSDRPTLLSADASSSPVTQSGQGKYTSSMIDRLCEGFDEQRQTQDSHNLHRTMESVLFTRVDSSRDSLQAQLAETDLTASSAFADNDDTKR